MHISRILAARFFAAQLTVKHLSQCSISWGVMHGVEGFPDQIGRDLDILVEPRSIHSIATSLADAILEMGWQVSILRMPWDVTQIIASRQIDDGATVAFEVDLVARQVWCGIPLTIGPPSDRNIRTLEGGMRIDAWGGFVKALLIQSLAGNWKKLTARKHEWMLDEHAKEVVRRELSCRVGEDLTRAYLVALESQDVEHLSRATKDLKWRLLRRGFLPPHLAPVECMRWAIHRLLQRTSRVPRTPLVRIHPAPGGSATSVSQLLEDIKSTIGSHLVFPGMRTIQDFAPLSRGRSEEILHLSAMGMLCVCLPGANEASDPIPWFPACGLVDINLLPEGPVVTRSSEGTQAFSGGFTAALTRGLMAAFHALHSQS